MLLEGIETLLVLSKEKTMSRTGSQLYISQSAVSKRIANLEKKLGKKLIVPAGRHIKLTADAEQLIASIGPTFNELHGLIFEQQTLEDNTPIRMDCSETLVAGYLGETMGRYRLSWGDDGALSPAGSAPCDHHQPHPKNCRKCAVR
ncbi:transcriptional regulator, LysR family [Vibrio mimicus SX-4]|nr:transcriptional regulator, LysR family [Vibrio mimicus SX-4]